MLSANGSQTIRVDENVELYQKKSRKYQINTEKGDKQ